MNPPLQKSLSSGTRITANRRMRPGNRKNRAANFGFGPATAQATDATAPNHARTMQDAGSQWIGYNTNLLSGADLTIAKPSTPGEVTPVPATLVPEISLRTSGGQVEVLWNKGTQEGVEIQKDSGTGQWTFLAVDTRPNFIDTTPMHAASAKWKYRAIYTRDAQRIGQWSNVAEITVGG